jgi:hypothetical protein
MVDSSTLLRELGRFLGDEFPLDGNNVQISLVLRRQTNQSTEEQSPEEEGHTDQEPSNQEPHLPSTESQSPPPPPQVSQARDTPKAKQTPTSVLPRGLFTDGWNSFWHMVEGIFAIKIPILVPICIIYQILDRRDVNVFVDILEFIFGHIVGWFFTYLL